MKNFNQLINLCKNALKPPAAPVVEKTTVTPRRFTLSEAHKILVVADEERRRSAGALRYGQSIWNAAYDVNPELMTFYNSTDKDFFHFRDDRTALKTFNSYYVEY